MSHTPTDLDKKVAGQMKKLGFHYTAKYIEKFGVDNMNPWFTKGVTDASESFYKKCVEENHPWDYYDDPPEPGDII